MVQGRWYPMGSDIETPLRLRGMVFGAARDALDDMAQQVVVFRQGEAVGCARLYWKDGAFWLDSLGVLEGERGKGFGDLLIRLCLFKALTHSAALIRLAATPDTEGFFAKYGLTASGEENGLTLMQIRGEDVQLSHCGGNCEGCKNRTEECTPKALR